MHAGVGGDGRHLGAQVQPELGIFLAETHRGRALDEPRQAERRKEMLVKRGARRQIAYGHGDVVDHARSLALVARLPVDESRGVDDVVFAGGRGRALAGADEQVGIAVARVPQLVVDLPQMHLEVALADGQRDRVGGAPRLRIHAQHGAERILLAGLHGALLVGLDDHLARGGAEQVFVVRDLGSRQQRQDYQQRFHHGGRRPKNLRTRRFEILKPPLPVEADRVLPAHGEKSVSVGRAGSASVFRSPQFLLGLQARNAQSWGGQSHGQDRLHRARQHGHAHGRQPGQEGPPGRGFDLVKANLEAAAKRGVEAAGSAAEAAKGADIVVTMLPAGKDTVAVYEKAGVLQAAAKGTVFIDSSTIDVASARRAHEMAKAAGMLSLDAPVSGGVGGAEAATLTFMAGGSKRRFDKAKPVLEAMGKRVVHCGDAGAGQAAKICNNMILGISMIGVAEAFVLAEKLGLSHQALFDVASTSSGPVLVADQLLPGARSGACLARQQQLQAGLCLGTDAEGPQAGAGSCGGCGCDHADGCGGGANLWIAQRLGRRRHRLLGDHPLDPRQEWLRAAPNVGSDPRANVSL